jgi:hypothetical protein
MAMSIRATTIRLPNTLLENVSRVAKGRGKSLNAFVVETLQKELLKEEARRLFDDYSLAGEDADVAFASDTQAEVMLRDPA